MPKIRQIVSEPGLSGRLPASQASAMAFGAGTAEGTGALGDAMLRTADFIQDNEDRADVSNVHAQMAKARADWTNTLAERARTAPAGDDTFAQKFNEDFDNYVVDARNVAKTRAGQMAFEQQAGELRGALLTRAAAFQAESIAVKAKADYGVMKDQYEAVLRTDPTQYSSIRESMLNALNDPNGQFARMSATDRMVLQRKTEEGLVAAQMRGLIITGAPELAKKKIMSGELDAVIDPKDKDELTKSAEVAIKSKEEAEDRKRRLDEIAKKQRTDEAMKKYLAKIIDPKTNGALTDPMILADPDLGWREQQHLADYRRARIKEMQAESGNRPNPGEVRRLMLEIHAATDDPKKTYNADGIMAAYTAGKINTNEMVFLRKEVEQLRDGNTQGFQKDVQNARNVAYTAITRSIPGQANPGMAADAAYRFTADLNAAIERKRAKNEDPRELLDPKSKEYMLDPARINSYMSSSSQALSAGTQQIRGAAPMTGALKTFREYDTLKKGEQYTDPQGNIRTKQ